MANWLVYSSDKGSPHLQLWIRDMKSGVARKVTNITTQPQGGAFSPDGKRIVFFTSTGMWRVRRCRSSTSIQAKVTKIHDSLPQPGAPTWAPDGRHVAIAGMRR
jgi:Tol biopolymer transport system component